MPDPELSQTQVPSSPTPAPQPPHTFFRGPNGIRAGWRVLLFLVLIAAEIMVVAIPIALILRLSRGGGHPRASIGFSGLTPLGLSINEAILFLFPVKFLRNHPLPLEYILHFSNNSWEHEQIAKA